MIGIGLGVVSALGSAGKLASGIMSSRARQGEIAAQIRALQIKRDQTVGLATARAGASGIEVGSRSTTAYLKALAGEFDREIAGLRSMKRQAGTADLIANVSTLLGGAASIYGTLGPLNNWWQKPTGG